MLKRFTLIFKFKFNMQSNQLEVSYVGEKKQLENKFHFFKLFIKLNRHLQWFKLDLNKVYYVLHGVRKGYMQSLINQL